MPLRLTPISFFLAFPNWHLLIVAAAGLLATVLAFAGLVDKKDIRSSVPRTIFAVLICLSFVAAIALAIYPYFYPSPLIPGAHK